MLVLSGLPGWTETSLRIATYNVELARRGPGLLLRDILKGDDPAVTVAADVIAEVAPDVLLLTGFDYDLRNAALGAFRDHLEERGAVYPHVFSRRPNTGIDSGFDLDGNGRLGEPRDMQGFGRFAGEGGMAILSRFPFRSNAKDISTLLWRDLPGAILPEGFYAEPALDVLRLSSTAHWDVPITVAGQEVRLLAYHAGPPVFDGPEDRNGRRNHDETRLWNLYLEGTIGSGVTQPFVILGDANLDPADGEGRGAAMKALIARSDVQDPRPRSPGGIAAANPEHRGNPGLDTADWRDEDGPGNLRVDYVLPSTAFRVLDAGVFWPAPSDPKAALLGLEEEGATRHRLVWVDLELEGQP